MSIWERAPFRLARKRVLRRPEQILKFIVFGEPGSRIGLGSYLDVPDSLSILSCGFEFSDWPDQEPFFSVGHADKENRIQSRTLPSHRNRFSPNTAIFPTVRRNSNVQRPQVARNRAVGASPKRVGAAGRRRAHRRASGDEAAGPLHRCRWQVIRGFPERIPPWRYAGRSPAPRRHAFRRNGGGRLPDAGGGSCGAAAERPGRSPSRSI